MIKTNIGNVNILINGHNLDCSMYELSNKGNLFNVDRRFRIEVDNIPDKEETVIDCILENQKSEPINVYAESGEDLALISFMINNMKLSIGVQGDIPGVIYDYLDDRLRIKVTEKASISRFDIFIAWITMDNIEKEEVYTWFAADPHWNNFVK